MADKSIINEVYRQAKNREIHPSGDFDSKKRWYPSDLLYNYTESVRTPSAAWPFSYMQHCRTKKFITRLITELNIVSLEDAIKTYKGLKNDWIN